MRVRTVCQHFVVRLHFERCTQDFHAVTIYNRRELIKKLHFSHVIPIARAELAVFSPEVGEMEYAATCSVIPLSLYIVAHICICKKPSDGDDGVAFLLPRSIAINTKCHDDSVASTPEGNSG